VPIDPPRNNHNKDDNDNTNYDFPLGNQPLVGVIDTGLGADNPDIDYGRVTLGYDRVGRDGNPLLRAGEGDEHGSHVLGIIGATRDNGVGIDGINDKAPLWVGRAIGSGQWARSLREFVDAAKRARQKNAVANLSLDLTQKNRDGSVTTRYKLTPEERKAIQYAQDNGVLIVAAAGNDGDVMSVLGQASQEFDNIITVGAADGENRASYSSYGNGLDILAPGGTTDNPVTSTVGDGLGTMAGTSVATARVTGAASLVWAANPSLNFSQVKEVLKATAQDLGATGWDQETGAGLLDLDQAVERAKVTRGLSYRPQKSLISNRWTIDRDVTAGERAVQNYRIAHPWGRRIYKGYLDQNNSYDQLKFTLNRPSYLQFSFPNTGGSAELYTASGRPRRLTKATTHHENRNILYSNAHLEPGNYYIKVNKGHRSNINYDLTMNFDAQSPNTIDGKYYLPRPVLAKKPSFKKPTPKPSKDLAKILQELAEAKARREREEARRKRERERKRREEQEKREAEANARKAIDLVKEKNSDWLGEVKRNGQGRKDVEFDWNTQLDNRVAAIKYFENGYIIWNGIHGVAYKEGSGFSRGQKAQPDPRQVRLHDWGLHNGRVEYGSYIGELERDDYYKFSVEKLDGFATNEHMLQFALRNNGHGDISSKDAQFQILDEKFNPIFLNTPWEPEKNTGKVGLTYLDSLPDGQIYYVRVKPEKDNLDYKVIMNLDSAGQDYSYPARNVGYLRGRQQFRDYIGNRGDTNGDYYKFYVDDKSFLRFSLGELEPGSKIKAEIVDGDNRVLPLDYFDGTYGDVTLEKGHYYLRLLPEGDTSTNYVLTTQMAEELGEYTGRHEFQNRDLWDDEAYYRFTVGEQGARDFHLKLKQREGFTNVELHRDVGSGIVNSELVRPDFSQGTPQGPKKLFFTGANSGNQNEDLYRRYDNLAPGRYIVKVNLDSDFDSSAKYDLAMNIDLAGNSLENARDLGDLSDKRVELEDFVGWNKGDPEDFYKFTTDNREIRLQFALRDITAGPHIDVLDENGNVIPLKEFDDGGGERYGNVVIPPHGTYYLRVKAPDDRDDSTNYKLVVNLTDDVGILLNGHKVDGDIYKVYKDDKIKGILKNPIRSVQRYNGSEYQIFEGGSIVSSSHGTFPLYGSIREYYVNTTGGLGGSLGPPTSGEYSSSTGLRQDFANGYITWNGSSYEGFDQNGVPLFGRGGGASSEAMEDFFELAKGQTGIRRLDNREDLRGECVSLVARYVQQVFLPKNDYRRTTKYAVAYGHGKDTARIVATLFNEYFEPFTKTDLPKRGAVISWPGGTHGHTGIVMESKWKDGKRMVKILESNHDNQRAKSEVRISDWKNIEYANGWTNPRVQTANGSTGDNNHSPEQPISKNRVNHRDYERFVKRVYDTDLKEKEPFLDKYINDKIFHNPETGFYAVGITSDTEEPPILVIRGTEPTDIPDLLDDLNPRSVGHKQFYTNKDEIKQWLETNKGAAVIGHSLGGALSQLVTAEFPNLVKETVTFNSPGISRSIADDFNDHQSREDVDVEVTHYIVSGDIVSLAGEAYLDGEAYLISYLDIGYLKAINPITEHLQTLEDKGVIENKQLVNFKKEDLPVQKDLSDPLFHYRDLDYLMFLLLLSNLGMVDLAILLMTRLGVESLRQFFGYMQKMAEESIELGKEIGEAVVGLSETLLTTIFDLMITGGQIAMEAISAMITFGKDILDKAFELVKTLGEQVWTMIKLVADFGKEMLDKVLEFLLNIGKNASYALERIITAAEISKQALELAFKLLKKLNP
jgi:hypothetical protein